MNSTGLTVTGHAWVLLSFVASLCTVTGFYVPVWIIGSLTINEMQTTAYFGSFRRCNYPYYDQETESLRLAKTCGRYSTFWNIPSTFWQISTITIALSCILSLLLTFTLIPACCMQDVISKTSALIIGLLQFITAVSISVGCVIYPLGWNIQEIKEACGPTAGPFTLGSCQFGWSYLLMLCGSFLHLLCGILSLKGSKRSPIFITTTSSSNARSKIILSNLDLPVATMGEESIIT